MSWFQPVRALRAVGVLCLGIVLGAALVGPVMAGHGTKASAAATQARAVSCHAFDFHPLSSGIAFEVTDDAYIWKKSPESATFACGIELPQRAIVTKVQFTVWDDDDEDRLDDCSLRESGLPAISAAGIHTIAEVVTPSDNQMPGTVRVSTTDIDNGTINNIAWAYYLQCTFVGNGLGSVGIYGADVQFKITAANG
jgi:hypothetical protein